jgi:hypothetical protein
MRKPFAALTGATLCLAGALTMAAWSVHSAEEGAQETPAPAGPDMVILDFRPGMDDLMTMIVQPRHIKMYYAAREQNWILARFQLNELRAAFMRIGDTIPEFGIFQVVPSLEAAIYPHLDAIDAAIATEDPAEFERAYTTLTAGCNECHEAIGFAFLVMKVPEGDVPADYIDQDFRAMTPPP